MARRPKATQTAETPDPAPESVPPSPAQAPVADGAPTSPRRGPKPKAAASAKSVKLSKRSGAPAGTAEAETPASDSPASEAGAGTARGYPNRTSKQTKEAMPAMPRRQSGKSTKADKPIKGPRGRKLRDALPDITSAEAGEVMAASPAGTDLPQEATTPAKPAAQWDQATDTVRFDWAEIEQIAAKQGPNQGMAKLLIAARAEGANSRWPL